MCKWSIRNKANICNAIIISSETERDYFDLVVYYYTYTIWNPIYNCTPISINDMNKIAEYALICFCDNMRSASIKNYKSGSYM